MEVTDFSFPLVLRVYFHTNLIAGPSYGWDVWYLSMSVCPSIVYPMVLSWKLSKTDPQWLRNTIRKLAPLILLPYSHLSPYVPWGHILVSNRTYNTFKYQYSRLFDLGIRPLSQLLPTSSHCRCCQLLSTDCDRRKLLSVVLTTTVVWCHTQTWGGPAAFHSHDILIINATVWHVLSIQLTLVCIDNSILHLVLKSVEPHASSTLLWCQSKLQQQ